MIQDGGLISISVTGLISPEQDSWGRVRDTQNEVLILPVHISGPELSILPLYTREHIFHISGVLWRGVAALALRA